MSLKTPKGSGSNLDEATLLTDLFDTDDRTLDTHLAEKATNRCKIVVGDARRILHEMPNGYFDCAVTSPPYWGLRDYGIDGQIGAETTVEEYIADLVRLFREVRRTLSDEGTLWLNIGDSYTSGGRTWRDADSKNKGRAMDYRAPTPAGLKPKDLIGVPWRLAFALQADGWYLRTDIIWNKPNCQPESVKDRPTRSHEYVFLFSKSEKYYYDWQAIMEPAADKKQKSKNRRTVWNINTEPYPGSHFAVYPRALVRLCVAAGSRENGQVLDPFFGSGTTGVVCNELGRKCVGIELNAEYAELARERLLRGH
ncbi:DNA modification methylase [Caballeronia novacaledonica]|uniref:Methyltransferase n=1 Tax=Caballeronia novacaledonica TaxID=1544861 RepID=A0A2U3I7C8_9BURK|nr:site-specific DNA-methyltransferase [Caballeronia novacaledonica]SPB16093.1 DNA modification methylase [Caballeronia novacaledonica]